MDKKILVDTDILIKSYRGEANKYEQLHLIEQKFAVSVITAFELSTGAQSTKQLISIRKELKAYVIIHLDTEISTIAYNLFKKHSATKKLKIADSLIAATTFRHKLKLYTDNKKDYNFIKGISFYNDK